MGTAGTSFRPLLNVISCNNGISSASLFAADDESSTARTMICAEHVSLVSGTHRTRHNELETKRNGMR